MKCPYNFQCEPICRKRYAKKNFICSGKPKKPEPSCDIVFLCLKGKLSSFSLGMTPAEAFDIITVLSARLSQILNS